LKIECRCPHCKALNEFTVGDHHYCVACGTNLLPHPTEAFTRNCELNQCPVCGGAHVYQQKDFNRKLGIGLLAIGVLLSVVTYGISLLVVTLVDYCLYRFVGDVGICYACQATFRDNAMIPKLPRFDLQLHDYYRSVAAP
jgi:hypothetical protein